MLLKVVQAKYIDEYKIEVQFNDSRLGIVNLKEKVFNDHRLIFNPLKEIGFFKNFKLNEWTIEWPNGLDLAPEYLYKLAFQESSESIVAVR